MSVNLVTDSLSQDWMSRTSVPESESASCSSRYLILRRRTTSRCNGARCRFRPRMGRARGRADMQADVFRPPGGGRETSRARRRLWEGKKEKRKQVIPHFGLRDRIRETNFSASPDRALPGAPSLLIACRPCLGQLSPLSGLT